jgi:hypothetical protein
MRRLVLAIAMWLAAASVLAGFLVWLAAPEDLINRKSYDAIQAGMSLQQVEVELGGPEGDYTDGRFAQRAIFGVCSECDEVAYEHVDNLEMEKQWTGREACVLVGLDKGGSVIYKQIRPVYPTGLSFYERCRRWTGL